MTSTVAKLADRADIIRASFSGMEKSIIKATKHNFKPPKEKHVRKLILYSREHHRIPNMINLLSHRMELPDWIVVMKTLTVFHRLFREGDPSFLEEAKYKVNIFTQLRRFVDMSSPAAQQQSVFIRKYSQYLEEKVLVYKALNIEIEKEMNAPKAFTIDEALDKLPRIQSQLNALLNCRAAKEHLNNPMIINTFGLLLKDCFRIYTALNDGIINLLELYFNLPKDNAKKALEIYKLFTRETDGVIQVVDICRRFTRGELPDIKHAPTSLVSALETYISDLESGKNPNPTADRNVAKSLLPATKNTDFNWEDDSSTHTEESFFDPRDSQPGSASASSTASPFSPTSPSSSSAPAQAQARQQPDAFGSLSAVPSSSPTNGAVRAPQASPPAPSAFDPFGTDNFSESLPTFGGPAAGANKPFDPFGSSSTAPVTAPRPEYEEKKLRIQMMMKDPVMPASSNSPAFGGANTGFGAAPGGFGSPAMNPGASAANPFGAQGSAFGNTGNSWGFGAAPPANNTANPFGAQTANTANANPFFGSQPAPSQQPVNNNPFF